MIPQKGKTVCKGGIIDGKPELLLLINNRGDLWLSENGTVVDMNNMRMFFFAKRIDINSSNVIRCPHYRAEVFYPQEFNSGKITYVDISDVDILTRKRLEAQKTLYEERKRIIQTIDSLAMTLDTLETALI